MPVKPVRFLFHKDISNLIARLWAKLPRDVVLEPEKEIGLISDQLVVATDGNTYVLEDLLNSEEQSKPHLCLAYDFQFDKVLPALELHKEHVLTNKKMAEILYQLYKAGSHQFALPTAATTGLAQLDFYLRQAGVENNAIDLDVLDLKKEMVVIPNKALTELVQLRFNHRHCRSYDGDEIQNDLEKQEELTNQKVEELTHQIAQIDSQIQEIESKLAQQKDFVARPTVELDKMARDLENQEKKYQRLLKIIPPIVQYATAALAVIPIVTTVALLILNPPLTTAGIIVGLSLGLATGIGSLVTGIFSSITTYMLSSFKLDDKLFRIRNKKWALQNFRDKTTQTDQLRKQQAPIVEKIETYKTRLGLLQQLKGRSKETYNLAKNKSALHQPPIIVVTPPKETTKQLSPRLG